MRAARTHQFGPPETLLIADVRLPTPGAGKAQVRIHDRGANSMDTLARTWGYGSEPLANFFFGRDLHLPHAPGIEPAGVVQGSDPALAAGTRVVPHSDLA